MFDTDLNLPECIHKPTDFETVFLFILVYGLEKSRVDKLASRLDDLTTLFRHLGDGKEKLKASFKTKHPSFWVCGRRLLCCVTQSHKKQSWRHVMPREVVFAVFLERAQLLLCCFRSSFFKCIRTTSELDEIHSCAESKQKRYLHSN